MFPRLSLKQITKDKLLTLACTDLGAFNKIGKNNLQNQGIDAIVLMEDRLPDFFISFQEYQSHQNTTLNRHGPFKHLFTQADLKQLVTELHDNGLKVYFGFWGQLMFKNDHVKTLEWINKHPELWYLHKSDESNFDLDPLVKIQPENKLFSEFVLEQFFKLKNVFDFDGLFLGDGLNGYRLFVDPSALNDQAHRQTDWTDFYQQLASGLHKLDCQLLAYDCLGFAPETAKLHGADYLSQAQAGLDYLIVQTYPTAWGKKWLKDWPGFDFKSCEKNLSATKEILKNTNCRTIYTLEMGDNIEGWLPSYFTSRKQLKKFKDLADGKLIVWANNLFFNLLK